MNMFLRITLSFIMLLVGQVVCAQEDASAFFLSQGTHPKNVWTITGILKNEQDEPYGFAFNLYRQESTFQVVAALYDLNEKKIIWQQTQSLKLSGQNQEIEQVGSFFWHFSPINASLIIGYEDQNTQVFNLKFDLLEPTEVTHTRSLAKHLKFKQFWSGRMNGHININHHEQFVTSDNIWLQQIWQKEADLEQHPFQELLCKFQDGSSLYAIQLPEKQAIHAALAARYDAQGQKVAISQFMNIKPPALNDFDMVLEKNKEYLHLSTVFNQNNLQLFGGHITPNELPGFCIYQNNPWSSLSELKPVIKTKDTFLSKTFAFSKKPFKIPFG